MAQYSNFNRVMEVRNHFKNGASSKSLMSRGNFLIIVSFVLLTLFSGCEKDNVNTKIIGKWERQNNELSGVYGIIITKNTYQWIDKDEESPACSAKITGSYLEVYCDNSTSKDLWSVKGDFLTLGLTRVYKRVDKFSWEEED